MKKSSLAIAALLTVLSTTQLSVAFAEDSNSAPAASTDNSAPAPATGDSNNAPASTSGDDKGDDTGS